jgi:hypothetical protein
MAWRYVLVCVQSKLACITNYKCSRIHAVDRPQCKWKCVSVPLGFDAVVYLCWTGSKLQVALNLYTHCSALFSPVQIAACGGVLPVWPNLHSWCGWQQCSTKILVGGMSKLLSAGYAYHMLLFLASKNCSPGAAVVWI